MLLVSRQPSALFGHTGTGIGPGSQTATSWTGVDIGTIFLVRWERVEKGFDKLRFERVVSTVN